MTTLLENRCTRCGEVFIPFGLFPEDMIHGETADGKPCGGIGVLAGQWIAPGTEQKFLKELGEVLTPQERHGIENPECTDPDCEFHHPEVQKSC